MSVKRECLLSKYRRYVLSIGALVLQSCAISSKEASKTIEDNALSARAYLDVAKIQQKQESLLSFVDANFVGDSPIDLPYYTSLPSIFLKKLA